LARRFYDQTVYGTVQEYRKDGWSNFQGFTLEAERRYSGGYGFQVFYKVGNLLEAGGRQWRVTVPEVNAYLPGAVPADFDERNRLLNYRRSDEVPKHRVRWNWIADLPFGRGKLLGRNAGEVVDKFIGGWQIAGMGSLRSTYFTLPVVEWLHSREPHQHHGPGDRQAQRGDGSARQLQARFRTPPAMAG
jgi:hypothetical protein